jgi:dipeptidyl aminopeptidase/acylaminoacyl peptidase
MKTKYIKLGLVLCTIFISSLSFSQIEFIHNQDVVYGYKDGMALVMDVYTPKERINKAGIIMVISGGMYSSPLMSHEAGSRPEVQNLLQAGYVVFATAHSSQPKYSADENRTDIQYAVRFIRYNSKQYGIDKNRIGIIGYSSGGHMSLMTALVPVPEYPESNDPIDKESSTLQAVVAYYPSTDLLNFGQDSTTLVEHFRSVGFNIDAAFDFHQWDDQVKRYERITNPDSLKVYFRKNSAISYVSINNPPVLIIHGSDDKLVPIQQSEILIEKLKKYGVPCRLITMPGQGHGWPKPLENEYLEVTSWFDMYLLK